MHTLKHNFSFRGQLSQSVYPDIFLTTKDAGSTDFIQAHRVVLAAVSDKLHGMCKEGGKVFIRNISYQVLEQVVRFIYEGSIEMESDEDIENLRDGLDMLKVNIVILGNGITNENEVPDETKYRLVDGDRDMNDTVGNPCVTDSGILVNMKDLGNEYLVKAPNLVDDENSSEVNHNRVGSQVKIKAASFSEVLESMSSLVENHPTHGSGTSTLIVVEEIDCDRTQISHKSVKVKCKPARNFILRPRMKLKLPKALMKEVQFESAEPNMQLGVNNDLVLQVNQMVENNEGVWKCKVCGKMGTARKNIRQHAEIHIEGMSYACTVCNKTFPNRHALSCHMYRIHSGLFSFDICVKSGMNRHSYQSHLKRKH